MDSKVNFNEFEEQVKNITKHSENVEELDFSCTLKNGTMVNYNYNSKTWAKEILKANNPSFISHSKLGSVISILMGIIAIVGIVLTSVFKTTNFSTHFTLMVYFSFIIVFSVMLSIYYLSTSSRLTKVQLYISRVNAVINTMILMLVWYYAIHLPLISIIISAILTAINLHLLYLQTKGSITLAYALQAAIALVVFAFSLTSSHDIKLVIASLALVVVGKSISAISIKKGRNEFSSTIYLIVNLLLIIGYFVA